MTRYNRHEVVATDNTPSLVRVPALAAYCLCWRAHCTNYTIHMQAGMGSVTKVYALPSRSDVRPGDVIVCTPRRGAEGVVITCYCNDAGKVTATWACMSTSKCPVTDYTMYIAIWQQ